MDGEEMPMRDPNPETRQEAVEEKVQASASAMALGGQAPTGVGPPLSASLPADHQHRPPDATRSNVPTQPTPQMAVSRAKGAAKNTSPHFP